MNIIILGPQGSGKGTQAKLLKEKLGLFYFESGDFLRELSKTNQKIKKLIDEGHMVPDEEMFSLVKEYLDEKVPEGDGMILDGYPRSVKQYELLRDWFKKRGKKIDHAIFLDISEKESIRRLSARRMDKKTGKIYNLITNPPGQEVDKKNLVQREDDKKDAIKERLDAYKEKTLPLVKKLEEEGVLIKVDGERPIKVIFEDILERLGVEDD